MAFRLSRRPSRQYIIFALLCIAIFFFVSLNITKPPTTTYPPPTRPIVDDEDTIVEYIKPEDHERLEDIRIDTTREEETAENQRKLIDRKYCGRDHCRFLLPITITEQESKAQMHFRQLAFLSGRLDRTIVLPNVHSSHLGVCRRMPFSFYYSYEWLENNKKFFNYITLDDFKEWARERAQIAIKPTAQELYIEVNENFHFLDGVQNCMQHYMNFEGRSTKRFVLEDPERLDRRQGNYSQILQTAMSDHTLNENYANGKVTDIPPLDVINLFYDRRFPYIEDSEVLEPLTYSSTWVNMAKGIADSLTPFVAIHWRMERLETLENLVLCAKNLVAQIQKLVADNGMTQYPPLFLLTDYPHLLNASTRTPESMSFKLSELQSAHHEAINYLLENLNITLTTIERPNQPIPYAELPEENWNIVPVPANSQPADTSVLGIVDKLVAMRAQWFWAGQPGVCAKASSFTLRIMEERKKQKDLQEDGKSLPGDPDIQGVAKFFTNEA
ncbi:hypothetical protein BGW37DRAFT_472296 [Umbelopsis sp. PMI_123]|nr:hypothetical protein BGW37DRAFT_472296 [Umbelopsis sp. PMI_123]